MKIKINCIAREFLNQEIAWFQTETEPIRKAIYETKVAPPGTTPRFMSMEAGVKEIQKVFTSVIFLYLLISFIDFHNNLFVTNKILCSECSYSVPDSILIAFINKTTELQLLSFYDYLP